MGVRGKSARINFEAISAVMAPTNEAWFNATVQIVDPDIQGGSFDRVTNVKLRDPQIMWEGPARIQAVRWPKVATTRQEAVSERTVVFHVPLAPTEPIPPLILEGWRIHVVDGALSPQLTNGLYVITTTVNSSYDWDRRIETVQDQGTSI
jgi:hypothetical protein